MIDTPVVVLSTFYSSSAEHPQFLLPLWGASVLAVNILAGLEFIISDSYKCHLCAVATRVL